MRKRGAPVLRKSRNEKRSFEQSAGVVKQVLFLSTFEKQIDKKGRVSVPPTFRAVLAAQSFNGIIVYPSFVHDCIEACGMDRMEKLYAHINDLDPFSQERDAFATAILGSAVQLPFDSEGRVVLPPSLLEQCGVGEAGVFVGKGDTFEIWSPEAHVKHASAARDLAKKQRLTLKSTGGAA